MAVTSNWTDPSDGGSMDRAAGEALTEAIYEYILSNFKFLGGTSGGNGFVKQINLLTNGGFEIWQRGAGPFTANGAYTSDRWMMGIQGTDTLSVSRESTIKKANSQYSLKATYTYGNGTGNTQIYQELKMSDGYYHLLGKTVSFRLPIHCNAASAVEVAVITNGTGGTTTLSGYHSGDSAWQDMDIAVTVPSDATYIAVYAKFYATCVVYLDNAMLVVGSQAVDYMPLHPAEELARCQRYYEVHGGVGASDIPYIIGSANGAHSIGQTMTFNTRKGGVPTLTKNGTWAVANCGQPTASNPQPSGYLIYVTATGAGQVSCQPNSADDSVTAEWNP